MEIIKPSVELWVNKDNIEHVARCARVCYQSDRNTNPDKLYDRLINDGHVSMLRHETHYYIVPRTKLFGHFSPYLTVAYDKDNWYISANGQWVMENRKLANRFATVGRIVSEKELLNTPGVCCIRRTFLVTTPISVTRELNRVSPNNIAEQSTRYVNFGKKGGVKIVEPHWYATSKWYIRWFAKLGFLCSSFFYNGLLKMGLPPQDAREELVLCTGSRAVYTYSLKEWKHILQLRYHGTTGKPHPNAKIIASKIKDYLDREGFSEWTSKD